MNASTGLNDPRITAFMALYRELAPGNISVEKLASVYHTNISFRDPMHAINGIDALTAYFSVLYENVTTIQFDFHNALVNDNECSVHWTMTYRHPRLYSGKRDIAVEGVSLLSWKDGRIIQHQDFFDGGSLVYEHLPFIGWVIRKLKERMV